MRRGDICTANLEPVRGSEADKQRPAVIVSNVTRVYPFQVLLPAQDSGLQRDSKAQAEQVRSIAVERIGATIGRVPPPLMDSLDDALRLHLAL
jgi:mRNA interferase MazF